MNEVIYMTAYAALSAGCWLVVAFATLFAVFSPRIQDTVTERIGLAWVCIGAIAAIVHIFRVGIVSDTVLFVSMGLAFYVLALVWKHWRYQHAPRRGERKS